MPRGEAPAESLGDAREIMNRALEAETGVVITFQSRRHALSFRHRLYAARKRDRQASRLAYEISDPRHNRSPYDSLAFFVEEQEHTSAWTLTIIKPEAPYGALRVEEI